ncbi:hypothetical protein PGR6_50060 [Pseudomonas sp. GR 6-02]|nr:hypothetical protein PGR6_50060 [Pseudomonas sp. GR 6-02]
MFSSGDDNVLFSERRSSAEWAQGSDGHQVWREIGGASKQGVE